MTLPRFYAIRRHQLRPRSSEPRGDFHDLIRSFGADPATGRGALIK